MKRLSFNKIILSAILLAVGMVLPFCTVQIKEIGDSLLPMHIPVMICGLVCGGKYGLLIGFLLPFLRSFVFGMPPAYPNAVWMALELATYGFAIGIIYNLKEKKGLVYLYFSLIISMISGRIVWGIAKTVLLGMAGKPFTLELFLTGAIFDAIPGIILQLILIPILLKALKKIFK